MSLFHMPSDNIALPYIVTLLIPYTWERQGVRYKIHINEVRFTVFSTCRFPAAQLFPRKPQLKPVRKKKKKKKKGIFKIDNSSTYTLPKFSGLEKKSTGEMRGCILCSDCRKRR
jgi:hypothetical protein